MSHGQHGQRWKFTSFSIKKVARPSGTTLQLAVNSPMCGYPIIDVLSFPTFSTPLLAATRTGKGDTAHDGSPPSKGPKPSDRAAFFNRVQTYSISFYSVCSI